MVSGTICTSHGCLSLHTLRRKEESGITAWCWSLSGRNGSDLVHRHVMPQSWKLWCDQSIYMRKLRDFKGMMAGKISLLHTSYTGINLWIHTIVASFLRSPCMVGTQEVLPKHFDGTWHSRFKFSLNVGKLDVSAIFHHQRACTGKSFYLTIIMVHNPCKLKQWLIHSQGMGFNFRQTSLDRSHKICPLIRPWLPCCATEKVYLVFKI